MRAVADTPSAVRQFDHAPDSGLIDLTSASIVAHRSRASLYRDNKAGVLPFVKVGNSTRIRVGDLRRLIGAAERGGAQ